MATLAEMYVQGVSTRKVKAITEELCGHAFSASAISAINKRLDESLGAFAELLRRVLVAPVAHPQIHPGGVNSDLLLLIVGMHEVEARHKSRQPLQVSRVFADEIAVGGVHHPLLAGGFLPMLPINSPQEL